MKKIFVIVLLSFLAGCATTSNKTKLELKNFITQGNYQAALDLVKSDKFYPRERSRLLKLVEIGMVKFLDGQYHQSLKSFDQAQDLSDKLFTVSISKKALSAVANSNADNYYGDRYERSLIRFYQAVNHFMLYQTGVYKARKELQKSKDGKENWIEIKEKKLSTKMRQTHLAAARASILEWDSLLENYRSLRGGKSVYKDDLTAKIFGAFIHEQIGSRSDLQIAKNLYKKAKEILFRNYNTYPAFNNKSDLFRKNFAKFSKMSKSVIKQKFVSPTSYYKELENFLDKRIGP